MTREVVVIVQIGWIEPSKEVYPSLEEAFRELYYRFSTEPFPKVLDAYSHQPIDQEYVKNKFNQYKTEYLNIRNKRYWEKHFYKFRSGPVPGITKKYGKWNGYRTPKTFQELREGPTRPSRNNLPTRWDDCTKDGIKNRNWKKFRKTQWRNIE